MEILSQNLFINKQNI